MVVTGNKSHWSTTDRNEGDDFILNRECLGDYLMNLECCVSLMDLNFIKNDNVQKINQDIFSKLL